MLNKDSGRYKRLEELGWDMKVLQDAVVIVVGAGALGNEVLKNLALLGVGRVLVVDMDKIEDHNLTRTVLFRTEDIGKYKAVVAAARVQEIDPNIEAKAFVGTVQDTLGLGVYQAADLVFGCVDNVQARIDVNQYCYRTGTTYIDAGLRKLDGDVLVFAPPFEVCLDCTITHASRNEAWKRFSCLKLRTYNDDDEPTLPTSPTISAIMAGFQVQIGIKYLHGASIPVNKRLSVFGYLDDMGVSKLSRNPACPTHSMYEPILEDTVRVLPHRSADLTLGELVKIAQQDFGNEDVSIDLNYDLITKLYCNIHDFKEVIFRKRGSLYIDEASCPECVAAGKSVLDSLMLEYFTNQIDANEKSELFEQTLASIGTPLYQIFKAKTFKNGEMRYRHYLIGGDRPLIFGDWKNL